MNATIMNIRLYQKLCQIFLVFFLMLFIFEKTCAAQSDSITVFAAASLTNGMEDIMKNFKSEKGIKVDANYAGSSILAKQILTGAQPDIYISANSKWMDAVENSGMIIKSSRINLLSNSLVLIIPKDSTLHIESWTDLALGEVKSITMGDPGHVPAGMYAKESLLNLGIWDRVKSKVIPAHDVRAALAFVERNEVDCGIVYKTDALISQKVNVTGSMPTDSHSTIVYPAAVISGDVNMDGAMEFMEFLNSVKAKEIFERHGFLYKATH